MGSRPGLHRLLGALAVIFAAAALCPPTAALADQPLAKPENREVRSRDGAYVAKMDVDARRTEIFRAGEAEPLWQVDGWFRVADLSDDGRTLVAGYPGNNLLDRDVSAGDALLTIYRMDRDTLIVSVGAVFADMGVLQPTVSHLQWGRFMGFGDDGRYRLETVDGRVLAIDVETGAIDDIGRTSGD